METKILKPDAAGIAEAGHILAEGGLTAFPTETVYGLGGSAFDADSVRKIYAAKGRPQDNPLIVHIADINQIEELAAEINDTARALIKRFMPGPFTIILKKSDKIPPEVTAGMDTAAIRFPSNDTAQRLIKAAGVPIAAPSANLSGKPSPTKAKHVIKDMTGRIEAIIDGGDCEVGVESTIVNASGEIPVLLRPGGVTYEMICEIAPQTIVAPHILKSLEADEKPLCPGMKYKHYAPDAEVTVVEGDTKAVKAEIDRRLAQNEDKLCGVLTMSENAYDSAVILHGGMTNREYAKNLFACLRKFDELGVELVFAEFQALDGYGLAVQNRLYKAAAQRVVRV